MWCPGVRLLEHRKPLLNRALLEARVTKVLLGPCRVGQGLIKPHPAARGTPPDLLGTSNRQISDPNPAGLAIEGSALLVAASPTLRRGSRRFQVGPSSRNLDSAVGSPSQRNPRIRRFGWPSQRNPRFGVYSRAGTAAGYLTCAPASPPWRCPLHPASPRSRPSTTAVARAGHSTELVSSPRVIGWCRRFCRSYMPMLNSYGVSSARHSWLTPPR